MALKLGAGHEVHTNTVENYFSILKRGITGCYFHVSEAHLHRYLAEFDFRYSNREGLGVDDTSRAEIALKGFRGKRLTYETAHPQAITKRENPILAGLGSVAVARSATGLLLHP